MGSRWEYLWESWFDKASWLAVIIILIVCGMMLYTNHQEVQASGTTIAEAAARSTVSRFIKERSPEVKKALSEAITLYDNKKYTETITAAENILKLEPEEPFAYLYLARAYREQGNIDQGIINYSRAIKLHPDFVDKKSEDFLGRERKELKPYVNQAIIYSKSEEFRSKPNYKEVLKHLYYLQRRMAGGCE
jgi:tetratricopeptide (TPR) repeat protein